MKISKLFHWLYACLMLLPIAVFIPTAFYYGFNEQAQAQVKTDTTNYLEYFNTTDNNEYYGYDELETNTLYSVAMWENYNDDETFFEFAYCDIINTYEDVYTSTSNKYGIKWQINSLMFRLYCYDKEYDILPDANEERFVFALIDNPHGNQPFAQYVDNEIDTSTLLIFGCSLKVATGNIDSETTTTTMSITDSMSTAWTNTWSNPLFSWSADSFLATPFNYLSDLFSIPQNSTFTMALSYWCAISIIYLVFDVIMYVPLLCHRWIDKAKIE